MAARGANPGVMVGEAGLGLEATADTLLLMGCGAQGPSDALLAPVTLVGGQG